MINKVFGMRWTIMFALCAGYLLSGVSPMSIYDSLSPAGVTADLNVTTADAVFSGTATASVATTTAAINVTTDNSNFSGSATVTALASLTLPALKNNTGTLLASESGATAYIYATSGAHVVTKTGQTTNGAGVMTITDAALVAATQYRVVVVLASGAEGMDKVTAS